MAISTRCDERSVHTGLIFILFLSISLRRASKLSRLSTRNITRASIATYCLMISLQKVPKSIRRISARGRCLAASRHMTRARENFSAEMARHIFDRPRRASAPWAMPNVDTRGAASRVAPPPPIERFSTRWMPMIGRRHRRYTPGFSDEMACVRQQDGRARSAIEGRAGRQYFLSCAHLLSPAGRTGLVANFSAT